MIAPNTIECVYERGVLRPLEEAQMGRCDLSKYYGILGKASAERLAELEGTNDSEDLELLQIEGNIEIGSPVRKAKGIIKLDPAVARDIADSE
ncbi:MAG: antitoxin family protein [Methanothrix sp.]|nr:antitoxin family protein [Methanothrix sp.]